MTDNRQPSDRPTLADRRGVNVDVYQPAEDSALLAGAVAEDLGPAAPSTVLDVGTGSGYVGSRLATATGAWVIAIDINPHACRQAKDHGLEPVLGDLVSPFRAGVFDAVVFNPPYLPADETASWDDWFEVAVTGGTTGRELIERFLDDVGRVLAPGGVVYLVVSTYTGVDTIVEHGGANGFSAVALVDAPYPGETLTVVKLLR